MKLPASMNMKWYGWVLCAAPILLVWILCGYDMLTLPRGPVVATFVFGAAGALTGAVATWLNARIFRSSLHAILKTLLIAVVSFVVIVLYAVPTVAIDTETR